MWDHIPNKFSTAGVWSVVTLGERKWGCVLHNIQGIQFGQKSQNLNFLIFDNACILRKLSEKTWGEIGTQIHLNTRVSPSKFEISFPAKKLWSIISYWTVDPILTKLKFVVCSNFLAFLILRASKSVKNKLIWFKFHFAILKSLACYLSSTAWNLDVETSNKSGWNFKGNQKRRFRFSA